ncbi:MAG TPA: hypothetical protein VGR76_07915, partial [Candidatus Angelobacter sp.]|nr:hypothetical protein [Candidatus Angelobacter sp.]
SAKPARSRSDFHGSFIDRGRMEKDQSQNAGCRADTARAGGNASDHKLWRGAADPFTSNVEPGCGCNCTH